MREISRQSVRRRRVRQVTHVTVTYDDTTKLKSKSAAAARGGGRQGGRRPLLPAAARAAAAARAFRGAACRVVVGASTKKAPKIDR